MTTANPPERIFSYVIPEVTGLAPHIGPDDLDPARMIATLAVCKNQVRKAAKPGDWVMAVSAAKSGHPRGTLVYALQVGEKIPFSQYFNDPRFQSRKPDVHPRGDNFYRPDEKGHLSLAFDNAAHAGQPRLIEKDLSAPFALAGRRFWYFGSNPVPLPENLAATDLALPDLRRRGHRVTGDPALITEFTNWISQFPEGINEPAAGAP
jgi:hypothetical protein